MVSSFKKLRFKKVSCSPFQSEWCDGPGTEDSPAVSPGRGALAPVAASATARWSTTAGDGGGGMCASGGFRVLAETQFSASYASCTRHETSCLHPFRHSSSRQEDLESDSS